MAAEAPTEVVSFPPVLGQNSYQRLLYQALGEHGFECVDGELKLGWLLANRRPAKVLHFHWPVEHWQHLGRFRRLGTAAKFVLFALRLAAARLLGYRIAWTIHEVFPLERGPNWRDRLGARVLAAACNVLLANDAQTAEAARRELGRVAARVEIVPHSSYVGAYPAGRSRTEVRAELGIPDDAVTFLLFGHISVYKRVEFFVEGFRRARLPNAALVVAGLVMHEPAADAVRAAAAEDPRVKPLLEFIADDRVAELFGAADAVISPRMDGGTSGVLILAMSMDRPSIVARLPAYETLTGGERCAWLFEAEDLDSLVAALERAASDGAGLRERAAACAEHVADLTWDGMAERIGTLLRGDTTAPERPLPVLGSPSPERTR